MTCQFKYVEVPIKTIDECHDSVKDIDQASNGGIQRSNQRLLLDVRDAGLLYISVHIWLNLTKFSIYEQQSR